jgi:hypothetical protein
MTLADRLDALLADFAMLRRQVAWLEQRVARLEDAAPNPEIAKAKYLDRPVPCQT